MSTKETLMEKYDSKQDQVNNANSAIIFLAVQDATFYSGDKIDKKYLSTGR